MIRRVLLALVLMAATTAITFPAANATPGRNSGKSQVASLTCDSASGLVSVTWKGADPVAVDISITRANGVTSTGVGLLSDSERKTNSRSITALDPNWPNLEVGVELMNNNFVATDTESAVCT